MEHTLGEPTLLSLIASLLGLNPCFSGTYSRSYSQLLKYICYVVLILVLVEHTLGEVREETTHGVRIVLILVLVEHTLGGRLLSLPCL